MWDPRPQFDLEAVSVSFLKTFHSGAAQRRNETSRADLILLPPSRIFVAKDDRPIAFDNWIYPSAWRGEGGYPNGGSSSSTACRIALSIKTN
jgi:hypothetical protein